jgi:hypothetical protein
MDITKMAICTNCGTIIHDDDVEFHICNPDTIATKGKEKRLIAEQVI